MSLGAMVGGLSVAAAAGGQLAPRELAIIIGASASAWLGLSLVAVRVGHAHAEPKGQQAGGVGHGGVRAIVVILAVAVLARMGVVLTSEPTLSDDIYRYILDGHVTAAGDNPYRLSPKDRLDTGDLPDTVGPASEQLAQRVNHPHLVTIYQPVSQGVFAALAIIQPTSLDPMGTTTFRLGFVLFDVLLIGVLLAWLRRVGASPWWATLYAWHPLAIIETAGSGHQDVIGISLLATGVMCSQQIIDQLRGDRADDATATPARPGIASGQSVPSVPPIAQLIAAGCLLALAVAVKPIVAPVGLIVAWRLRHRFMSVCVLAAAGCLTLAACYLPFAVMPGGLAGLVDTIGRFVSDWSFNGAIHSAAIAAGASKAWADGIMAGLLLASMIVIALSRARLATAAMAYVTIALLLSSTIHPWYLLWALPWLVVVRSWTVWMWSLGILFAYTAHLSPDNFEPMPWASSLQYTMVGVGMAIDVLRWARQRSRVNSDAQTIANPSGLT